MVAHKDAERSALEDEIVNLKKEVAMRDVVIANLDRERNSIKTMRSQVRRLLRTVNNNVLERLSTMKQRNKIDKSNEAEVILDKVDIKQDNGKVLQMLQHHDKVIDSIEFEPHTYKTVIAEVSYWIYDSFRKILRFIILGLVKNAHKFLRRLS